MHATTSTSYHQLTHCDVVESVEWFIGCSETHCHRMLYLSTVKRLHVKKVRWRQISICKLLGVTHIVEHFKSLVGIGMIVRDIMTQFIH